MIVSHLFYEWSFKLMRRQQDNYSWVIDCLTLTLILGGLFAILLGTRPLLVPDEGRYAEIAREMIQSQDYLTPTLNGIKYFEKPILFYWLEAIAIHFGGLNIWALRSVNACLGLLGCLLTYFTARKLYDRTTGFMASLILGTSTLYFTMSHMINLDLPVSVFISGSLYCFLLSIQQPHARFYCYGSAIFAALAVLSKGLIGIVFPLMIISAWILLLREWSLLKRLYLPSAILIFLLIIIPWHLLVSLHHPEFFHFYFIEQHFLRYATKAIGHYQPVWFFIPYLILGLFPWIAFLPAVLIKIVPLFYKHPQLYKRELFFFLWALLIFVFFSFSKSKLIPYILPVIPPLAILTARYLYLVFSKREFIGLRIGFFILLFTSIVIASTYIWFIHHGPLPNPVSARLYLYLAASTLLIGMLAALICAFLKPIYSIVIVLLTSSAFYLLSLAAVPAIDTRTIQPLAITLKKILHPQDEVMTYHQYYQDLPFYLEKQVTIVNWQNELSFGMKHQDTKAWMINDEEFNKRFRSNKRVFVFMTLKNYEQLQQTEPRIKLWLIDKTLTNALVTNKELDSLTH